MSSRERLKSVLESIKSSGKLEGDAFDDLNHEERETVRNLYNDGLVDEALRFVEDLDAEQEWGSLWKKVDTGQKREIPLWKSVLRYAAIFIGLTAAVYFYRMEIKETAETPSSIESITLKTDGEAVRLIQEGENQQIISASGKVLGKQEGNKITHGPDAEIDELIYNELEVPYGKIFDVELSDGTLVHLNSGTKIRYPVKFLNGQKREVFIEGEAYFKVAKDNKHPFIVHSDAVEVKVLGTEFNITSFKEDAEIKTVLVEGRVGLSNSIDAKEIILKPGQKGAWSKTGHTTKIEKVDVDLYTSWIKGEMIFRDMSFGDMTKKLERKYNLNIQNNNELLRDKKLNARFNVEVERIEDVLNSIREIQHFEYSIADGTITIY